MIRILSDLIFPPRTSAPQTPPPADPGPSCMSAGVSADPNLGLILGVVCAVALITVVLTVVLTIGSRGRKRKSA